MGDRAARLTALILCTALLGGQREAGVGAHTLNYVMGCRFNSSAPGGWSYVELHTYDREVTDYFDVARRKFVAVKEWVRRDVDRWNEEEAEARYQGSFRVCENNIRITERWVLSRRVEPEITVRPKVSPSHSGQSALLTCHVTGFYPPPHIKVTWLKNGAPVPTGAINTDLLSDGDWTYQVEELLQYRPVSGDRYTCRVEHISLTEPKTVDWEVPSSPESERTKITVGALGFVLGLLILLAGVIMKLRNAKALNLHIDAITEKARQQLCFSRSFRRFATLDCSSLGPRLMGPAIS